MLDPQKQMHTLLILQINLLLETELLETTGFCLFAGYV